VRTPEEFDAFLREEIAPRLRKVESERRAVRAKRDALALPVAAKLAGAALGIALGYATNSLAMLLVGAAIPFAIEAMRKAKVTDTATPLARCTILEPVITFWDPSFRYQPSGTISRAEFEASRLFAGDSFNTYAGEDLVTGRHGSTSFRFSELHVKDVTRRKNRSETKTVFDGLFFVGDFNKSFRGQTLVLPDTAERALGSFGRAFQSLASGASGLQLVELEDPAFERAFTVRSTDPVEARYLLSTSLMQRILAFHGNTGAKLRLGFLGGRVYVAVPLPGNLFDMQGGLIGSFGSAAALAKPLSLDDVRRWGGELLFATSIVDELDLNTRIWSKAAPAA
jgi:Protein of unknown function (DUF3137)